MDKDRELAEGEVLRSNILFLWIKHLADSDAAR
jgi:hypothetical protein